MVLATILFAYGGVFNAALPDDFDVPLVATAVACSARTPSIRVFVPVRRGFHLNERAKERSSNDHRSVRSFVRRAGRITSAQQEAIERLWPRYGVDLPHGNLNLDELFGRTAERVLEIGFGNGDSLVLQAAANPALDFFGIEVHQPGVGHCLLLAEAASLRNLRLACQDAVDALKENIADRSFVRVNLYFPDPWPKKRHHKRRLLQNERVAIAEADLEYAFRCATEEFVEVQVFVGHIDAVARP